ncbi:hemerythrin domain-containing protein [Hoeflea sp. TYP-13]|uniref:hemerythrin domain-containing protein n=1 Tax=Hoeflea sp. TYP-13 TaxID=3230023 RepID=UPI0034C60512
MNRLEEVRAMTIKALETAPPVSQLLSPLEYILSDHFRQRALCHALDDLADSDTFDRELAAAALGFLQTEFSPHVIDEEEDLFPLLRRRAQPEDDIEEVLGELSLEHATDRDDADRLIEELTRAVETGGDGFPSSELAEILHRFAANERRHLMVENAIVMPLARVRLTADDQRNLGRRMAARRGVDYPEKLNAD